MLLSGYDGLMDLAAGMELTHPPGTGTGVTGTGTGVCVSPEELVSAAIHGLMFGLLVDACC